MIRTETALAQIALAMGAAGAGGSLSAAERNLADAAAVLPRVLPGEVARVRAAIRAGEDPLGEAFCKLRDAATRRADGAVYTPGQLVGPMVDWVLDQQPGRVVTAAAGRAGSSARYSAGVREQRPSRSIPTRLPR